MEISLKAQEYLEEWAGEQEEKYKTRGVPTFKGIPKEPIKTGRTPLGRQENQDRHKRQMKKM